MSFAEAYLTPDVGFSWGEESPYRTRPTNIDQYLRVIDQDIPFPEKEVWQQHVFGHGRKPAYTSSRAKAKCDGSLSIEVIDGDFLGAIFGVTGTEGSDPYTHTLPMGGKLPSFSAQIPALMSANNLITEFLGCRVDQATFKASDESPVLMCDIDYMAATPLDGGATPETVSLSVVKPYLFKMGVLTSTEMWGGAKARIHSFELPVKNNCKPDYAGGYQYYPYEIVPGKFEFGDMKIGVGIEDGTEWNEILDDDDKPYNLTYLFTRGVDDTMQFTLTNAKLKATPHALDDNALKADLVLIPTAGEIETIDDNPTYSFE